jgi:hypothetical protein
LEEIKRENSATIINNQDKRNAKSYSSLSRLATMSTKETKAQIKRKISG